MVLAAVVAALFVSGAQARGRQLIPGRIVVKLRQGMGTADLGSRLQSLGCRVRANAEGSGATTQALQPDAIDTVKLDVDESSRGQVLNELAARTDVRFAAPVYNYSPSLTPNDPRFSSQYHHRLMNSQSAWDVTVGSSAIKIAILDTGVDPDHPDLQAKLLPGFNSFSNNTNTADVEGHGTAVAGCAAAITNNSVGVAGMSWNSPIIPVRISDRSGLAPSDAIADGIRWAADNGAKVINISFGPLQDDTIVLNAAAYARSRGALVFASMGNDGTRESASENPNIIFVTATDSSDSAADFTSFGPAARLAAPGVSIPSTNDGGGFGNWSGTSFSSPIAAGAAALVWSVNPSMTPAQVENALFSTARDLGNAGRDELFGFGRVDVSAAVAAAQQVATGPAKADLVSPIPGSRFAGATVTFQWSAGTGASGYFLYVGSDANSSQFFGSPLAAGVTSQTVSGLPTDGRAVKVWLYTLINGVYQPNIYTFTAASPPANAKADMTSPAPGSRLSGSSVTFRWSAGTNAQSYFLYVGTDSNSSQYFGSNVGLATSQTVNNLPTDGSAIKVWLYTQLAGTYQPNIYTYTASAGTPLAKAELSSPAPGSTLTGTSATFRWTAGSGAEAYFLYVGTESNSTKYFGSNVGLNTSQTVTNLPTDGSAIKVWLYTQLRGVFQENTYRLTAASASGPVLAKAELTSPAPGSALSGTAATFRWTAGSGAQSYFLYVGTTGNSTKYFGSNVGLNTSQTVSNLPTDGSTIRVWLYTQLNGVYQENQYTLTAAQISAGVKAQLINPAPGSVISASSVTFRWDAGTNATAYHLYVGNNRDSGRYFQGNVGLNLSRTVNGLPLDGSTVRVWLYTQINGVWHESTYSFTMAQATRARITSPAPGATITSSTATFEWDAGIGASQYWLYVGTPGNSTRFFSGNVGTSRSRTISGLPTDGTTVRVFLYSLIDGYWYERVHDFATGSSAD